MKDDPRKGRDPTENWPKRMVAMKRRSRVLSEDNGSRNWQMKTKDFCLSQIYVLNPKNESRKQLNFADLNKP